MAGETPPKRRGRKRGARGQLRKAQEIDRVHVHQPFELHLPDHAVEAGERKAGEGCYVSTTIHNRRYYGVLVDQAALKAASMLHFQNEAAGFELNRKIELLKQQKLDQEQSVEDRKRHADSDESHDSDIKRIRLADGPANIPSDQRKSNGILTGRPVQKFRYVDPVLANGKAPAIPGYRILLATYADAMVAADDDPVKATLIEAACQSGGGYIGTQHYFQYETKCENLQAFDPDCKTTVIEGLRMSLGFHSFLQHVALPDWFPLANLQQAGQSKVLSLLNMKKDNNGNVIFDENAAATKTDLLPAQTSVELIPMEPRSCFRVCVVGGGVAGLSCCLEIFRICEKEKIDVEIVLVEGRSRLGGRLWTDRETFTTPDGKSFPVDLGASWIHGIDQNPMAALAKEAGADFITTSEDVKMFQAGGEEIDAKKDEQAGEMFDNLLDFAANDCWTLDDSTQTILTKQAAVRWYASVLGGSYQGASDASPLATRPPSYRQSSDISIDNAIGRAILKHKLSEFSILSDEERRMLVWNLKNIEYALGANVEDLSMQWWDIDEHHAFEGDHVLLKQGYSTVIDHLHNQLRKRGDRFQCKLGFAVGTIDYNRKTMTYPPPCRGGRGRKSIELSDTCSVSSQDGAQTVKCDFVVSAVPLGVLKASAVEREGDEETRLSFQPPLPFLKRDAIESVGFGLLNKVYLQFPFPFWRKEELVGSKYAQFGNASGVHPHHYMFLDVGKTLEGTVSSPSILMSLISGREATMCERLSDESLVEQVMETLKTLFSNVEVPNPITFKVTRWGSDEFSRGCYTFLTPGTTDQDFGILQTPVNGNGDSLLLEGSETMRLFFAGEHTTALHPSMAHGALLSGIRVAKEVVEAMNVSLENNDESLDKLMPMSMFRYLNPKRDIRCCLCHKSGMRIREGNLLVFRKGTRQVLVHTNCAEYSPEVEVFEGQWKDVFTTVNRSKNVECILCGLTGATIGCAYRNCDRCYHFSCGEDTGWRFAVDGKQFYCDLHRSVQRSGSESFRVSMAYFQSKSKKKIVCALCDRSDDAAAGELLAFQRHVLGKEELVVVHEKCIRNTSIIDVGEEKLSHLDKEFRNVFTAIDRSRLNKCPTCLKKGASVLCAVPACMQCLHVPCAEAVGWKFDKQGPKFRCAAHGKDTVQTSANNEDGHATYIASTMPGVKLSDDNGGAVGNKNGVTALLDGSDDDSSEVPELTTSIFDEPNEETALMPSDIPLAMRTARRRDSRWVPMLVRLARKSILARWNLELFATCLEGTLARVLTVAATISSPVDPLEEGDIVRAINGVKVGSKELSTLRQVYAFLRREVELVLEIHRRRKQDNPWI